MNKAGLLGLIFLPMLHAYGATNAVAPVAAVVLFPGGATVTRVVQIAPGTTRIEIPDLPSGFDVQTLRGDADPGIRIGQIVVQDVGATEAANPTEAALEAKLQALRDQQAELDAQHKAADMVRAYLERFGAGDAAGNERSGTIDAKTLAGLIDTLGRGAGDALARMQQIAVQKREIGKKIAALERDLARLRSGPKDRRSLAVSLTAERAGTLRISYQVPQAGWKPAYRATLDAEKSSVNLERLSMVSQKTGEDWNNVALRLSTNQPRLSPQAPEPKPWLLSYAPPRPVAEQRTAKPAMVAAAPPAPAARPQENAAGAEADYRPPTFQTESAYATEFEVPGRVSLAADGREIVLPLAATTLPVKQRLRIVPRQDKAAIVTAEAERPEGVWPAGNLQLFRDNHYVGATHWNPQADERFVLSFGRDDLVRVALDPVKGQTGTAGIFERQKQRRIVDRITLTSAHKKPVEVLVLESAPVSKSEEIKVTAQYAPPPTSENWERREGVVAWEATLAPKASATFSVDYLIEHPSDGWVSGLR